MKTLDVSAARNQRAKKPDGINLMARKGTVEDLAECYALHESLALPYTKKSWRILPEMWRTLLSGGAMQLCLVANRARLVGSPIVSFSAVLFVTDKFCSEARSTLPPYLGVELARRYLSGQLPVLNREQVARANAGEGLNVVMCFEGWMHDRFSPEQFLAVREKHSEAFHLALNGYCVKEFLANEIGEKNLQWMLDAGTRLRRDYSNCFGKSGLREPESSRRPWLVGLTQEEAFVHPGSSVAALFIYTAPRFHFSRSQRVLLQHALMGETCETLAKSLSLSPWTVKKRWSAIYDRVADVDSELLPPSMSYSAHVSSRGAERRRYLLNYLRQHLEELRPYEPPKRQMAHIEARRLRTRFVDSSSTERKVSPAQRVGLGESVRMR
jgi:DNA-binding CsgD family transcriptional regulator